MSLSFVFRLLSLVVVRLELVNQANEQRLEKLGRKFSFHSEKCLRTFFFFLRLGKKKDKSEEELFRGIWHSASSRKENSSHVRIIFEEAELVAKPRNRKNL